MKRKGFTLIEVIVVIAIIGVLAAILVPAMLGYVTKSRIMAANTAARDLNTAISIAMLDLKQQEFSYYLLDADYSFDSSDIENAEDVKISGLNRKSKADMEKLILNRIREYFTSTATVDSVAFHLQGGASSAVGVINRGYPGSFPIAISTDDFRAQENWDADKALEFAMNK